MDHLSKEKRSWNMSRIHSKDTKPEIKVRKYLHNLGYRFRLNGKISKKFYSKGVLPGKPDLVMKKLNTVVFVNGCFWHRHENCRRSSKPKSNKVYWQNKIQKNVERDEKNYQILKDMGWNVIILWECKINTSEMAEYIFQQFKDTGIVLHTND